MTKRKYSLVQFVSILIIAAVLVGCGGPSAAKLAAVDYTPLPGDDWNVSTPEEQGLDSELVSEMYFNAAKLETLYSLLVIKNGYLIAEDYFNEGSVEQKDRLQSVTKSFTSALVGIALEQGCLSSVDQKMLDFFPEVADEIPQRRGCPSSLGWSFIRSLSASHRRFSPGQRSGNQVPLQQFILKLVGDHR